MTTTPDPKTVREIARVGHAERDDEIVRLRRLLGIGIDREQWDAIAEAEGARFEYDQTDDNLVGYLAYRYEDMKAQRHILLREIEEAHVERDGDVRAVDAMLVAYVRNDADEIREAFDSLRDRFICRIAELEVRDTQAALEARDAKGGESDD